MTEISHGETIVSRQLRQLADMGIREVVMTTGPFDAVLAKYCQSLDLPLQITFVKNPRYRETNYIYSIYCAKEYLDDDILLMHGDLVFENSVLEEVLQNGQSCMVVSSTQELPEKDFKASVQNGVVKKVAVDCFDDAVAAQPLYLLKKQDWKVWLEKMTEYCETGTVKCYAEDALNQVTDICRIYPLDIKNRLCGEIDTPEDLAVISGKLKDIASRTVYMCFSTDIVHSGHIKIIPEGRTVGPADYRGALRRGGSKL